MASFLFAYGLMVAIASGEFRPVSLAVVRTSPEWLVPRGGDMAINPETIKRDAYTPVPWQSEHLSDEDVAYLLDKSDKRSRAARKAQETLRQRRAEEQVAQEKGTGKC